MKSLIEKIFKREPSINYIIAEYSPVMPSMSRAISKEAEAKRAEYESSEVIEHDEMEIDNLYQKN